MCDFGFQGLDSLVSLDQLFPQIDESSVEDLDGLRFTGKPGSVGRKFKLARDVH
jgi:hypothetical protein